MSVPERRKDRARAFVPDLIPEPKDLERAGPLTPRERRDLDRIHDARDHHQNAKWMRGMALESAFRRRLYRGDDGERTRQGYLDDEWDGISESAAYLEIREWRLAAQVAASGRPAPDTHIRALRDVAEAQGHEVVAKWYEELRAHGAETGRRVTAQVVTRLAEYLKAGGRPELEKLFAPPRRRQLAPAKSAGDPPHDSTTVTGRVVPPRDSFQNFGTAGEAAETGPTAEAEPDTGAWTLSDEHVVRLSAWVEAEAEIAGIPPDLVAERLLEALAAHPPTWVQPAD